MTKPSSDNQHKITSIGGSALIEGIMMRGPKKTTVCGRLDEDAVYVEDISVNTLSSKSKIWRIPIIRGIAGLIDSMKLSYKALELSADKALEAGEIEEEEPSKLETWLTEKFGDNLMKVIMVVATVLGVLLAVALFFFLPTYLYKLVCLIFPALDGVVIFQSIFEGVLKIAIFLVYIILCSRMEEMKRVFMYHGAEHKTIFCYENNEELTVENVRKQSRFHPRCGTSFLVVALLMGILVGLFIPAKPFGITFLRPVFKLLLLPLMVGLSYEFIKVCGKYDNKITRFFATPGLWAQRITTKEPEDGMISCAIIAMKAVIPDDGSDIIK
ncbi:MAG: DUF1385 domain-containing protein [Oscillospiraceae bacterium]|nr:DUF1385 domain-containing protein [Candidatus Ruminococcus equi]